jgi:autoinducer 2 (AI-2) kinase
LVAWEKVFDPNPENHKIYLEIFERWHETYQRALEMVEKGAVIPMWRVAGT